MIKTEKWKSIVGYEDLYEVSDLGRVRSLNYKRTGDVKVLSPADNGKGYLTVQLTKNGKIKRFLVHRLVVTSFIGKIPDGMVVNHINEDKRDNRLENLEIVTPKENTNYGTRNERAGKSLSKALKGNTNANKLLKLTNAKTSAKYTFPSSYEASAFFGYRKSAFANFIFRARQRGENWLTVKGKKYFFAQQA